MARGYDTADFKRRLRKLPKVMRRELSAALEKDADEWVKVSKMLAPRDPEDGTPLADSILRHGTETGGQVVRAGGETTTKPSAGGPFDYAVGQEFGTQNGPRQPFFWPAYRLLRKKFTSRRRRALSKAIKEISDG
ncbi:HK97 gp10 family phage protein [Agrobacterium sp. Ap1]|uniref:HK97-gp10 family putative phage morphogenesis protein n=1 Tax=Agrobacterium sp. Ap1 TaxID=2815337 RepID=UPI001A8DA580|nr:HK97-gp10 family putative phage morphogenesis protein [Agrobacterium sp. Ap1]MBO0140219.1 HK97 gp10 family phage protein [Agrobacterium sp. Ap1]